MTTNSTNGVSYWLDFERPHWPALEGDLTTDVAIIGAGISGLKLAHQLTRHGIRSVILEGDRVGEGASGRNQGSLCHEASMPYAECVQFLKEKCGDEARKYARELWQLGLENLSLARTQIELYEIDCGFEELGFHYLARADSPTFTADLERLRQDYELLREDGFDVEWLDQVDARRAGGNELFAGGMCFARDSQFHSGRYVVGLALGVCRAGGVKLFEGTRVSEIKQEGSGVRVVTPKGTVTAEHVFLATNALAPQHVPSLAPALRAERGQVLVTEPLSKRPCIGGFGTWMGWWRDVPEPDGTYRLLFGGARHRDGPDSLFRQFDAQGRPHPKLESEGFRPSDEHQARLDKEFRTLFPQLAGVRITHRWGGLQSFTADGLPVIGLFDAGRRIHGMAGFSGRGNTYTDVGAEVLAARMAGVKSAIGKRYGQLIATLMEVGRPSSHWGAWQTSNE